jgi:tetratricopeptide (TPR) repeat protein
MQRKTRIAPIAALLLGAMLLLQSQTIAVIAAQNIAARLAIGVHQGKLTDTEAAKEAITWLQKILDWQPEDLNQNARRLLAHLYLQINEPLGGLLLLEPSQPDCDDVLTCYLYGQTLYALNRKDEAIAVWQLLHGVDEYFATQGDLAFNSNDKEQAFDLYNVSWRISDTSTKTKATMLLNLCGEYRLRNQVREAVYWCEQAVASRNDYWTQLELGRTYYEAGRYDMARDLLTTLVQSNPDRGTAYHWLGLSLWKLGHSQEGVEMIRLSINLDPSYVWGYVDLGNVLTLQGDYLSARCAYLKARELTERTALLQDLQAKIESLPKIENAIIDCGS